MIFPRKESKLETAFMTFNALRDIDRGLTVQSGEK